MKIKVVDKSYPIFYKFKAGKMVFDGVAINHYALSKFNGAVL